MSPTNRRDLIKGAVLLPIAAQVRTQPARQAGGTRPVVIASANGIRAVEKAYSVLAAGGDPLDAVISGVNIVEDDPNDVTVGYGGIPNEEGVVQLDASVMDGRTMKAGAVGALENIKNPSKVARLVMERTNRVFLVGPGALKFAKAHGFPEENLLTERSRKIWLYWKEKLSGHDDNLRSLLQASGPPRRFSRDRSWPLRGRAGRSLRVDRLGGREPAFLRLAHGRRIHAAGEVSGGSGLEDAGADLRACPGEPGRSGAPEDRVQHQFLCRQQEGGVRRRRALVGVSLRGGRRLGREPEGLRLSVQARKALSIGSEIPS